jgi:hypothetical protein
MREGELTPAQVDVLRVLAGVVPPWRLVGGGALAGFHTTVAVQAGHAGVARLGHVFHIEAPMSSGRPAYIAESIPNPNLPPRTIADAPSPTKKGPKPLRRRARKPSGATAMMRNTAVARKSHREWSKNPSPSDVNTLA